MGSRTTILLMVVGTIVMFALTPFLRDRTIERRDPWHDKTGRFAPNGYTKGIRYE